MQQKDWKKWCRLCGYQDSSDININFKCENTDTIGETIFKYFGIMIEENKSCTKICIRCHDTINSIIKYNAHVIKINEMFLELESNYLNRNYNLKSLREKYELNDEPNKIFCNEIKSTEFCFSNVTNDFKSNSRIQNNKIPSSKYCLKTELVDGNDVESLEYDIPLDQEEDMEPTLNNEITLADQKSLIDHHLTDLEEKKFKCPKCEKPFKLKRYVVDHIRRTHKKDKPFVCDICGLAFGVKKDLLDHHLTHPEERKYKCTKCEKLFKKKRDLKTHFIIHDGTGCICQICGQKLSTKKILRIHMLVHSDENKYRCSFCSKQFKRSNAFKNHLILHTGLKPYECPFCKLTFANGSNCRKHQRTVHPIELAARDSDELKDHKHSRIMPTIKQLNALASEKN